MVDKLFYPEPDPRSYKERMEEGRRNMNPEYLELVEGRGALHEPWPFEYEDAGLIPPRERMRLPYDEQTGNSASPFPHE